MRTVLLALVAGLALPAQSAVIARQGSDWVQLSDKPCTLQVPQAEQRRMAEAFVGGAKYPACWLPMQGAVHLVYEDGDQGAIPMEHFRDEPGI